MCSCLPAHSSPASPAPGCTATTWKAGSTVSTPSLHIIYSYSFWCKNWASPPLWNWPELVVPEELLSRAHHPLPWFLLIIILWPILLSLLRLLPVSKGVNIIDICRYIRVWKSDLIRPSQDLSLLCHFSDTVHVVSSNLLWHHTAHCQLQLQQGRSKAVILGDGDEHSQEITCAYAGRHTHRLNIESDNRHTASKHSTNKNNDLA